MRENKERFWQLLILSFFAMFALGLALFYNAYTFRLSPREDLARLLAEDNSFEMEVRKIKTTVKKLHADVMLFDPEVNALFIENDIRNGVGVIRSVYESKAHDSRYDAFLQLSISYLDLFADKRELKGNIDNVKMIRQSVEGCRLITEQLQESMGTASK